MYATHPLRSFTATPFYPFRLDLAAVDTQGENVVIHPPNLIAILTSDARVVRPPPAPFLGLCAKCEASDRSADLLLSPGRRAPQVERRGPLNTVPPHRSGSSAHIPPAWPPYFSRKPMSAQMEVEKPRVGGPFRPCSRPASAAPLESFSHRCGTFASS